MYRYYTNHTYNFFKYCIQVTNKISLNDKYTLTKGKRPFSFEKTLTYHFLVDPLPENDIVLCQ